MNRALAVLASLLVTVACASTNSAPSCNLVPAADHHQHLLSAEAAKLGGEHPLAAIDVLPEIVQLLADRAARWNDKKALQDLFTEDSVVYTFDAHNWIKGRADVADYLGGRFARPYTVTPVAAHLDGETGYLIGYFTRPDKHFGEVQMSLRKGADGKWRIAAESPVFPGPAVLAEYNADQLIKNLDAAGIHRAVVLSTAYWFGSPFHKNVENELAKVRAENDWTADQVARYPGRLIAFMSVNPLKDYALGELERCAKSGRFKGVKLHFGNSQIDLKNPQHVATMKEFFRAANRLRMPMLRTSGRPTPPTAPNTPRSSSTNSSPRRPTSSSRSPTSPAAAPATPTPPSPSSPTPSRKTTHAPKTSISTSPPSPTSSPRSN